MLSLLKADLFRIFRGKLARIGLIISVVLPVVIVLIYYAADASLASITDGEDVTFGLFSASSLIKTSFSVSDNMGLVIIIFSVIFVSLDIVNGTLRNKVIAGHSRTSIYCSHLLSSIIYNLVMIIIYTSITTLLTLLLFKRNNPFSADEIRGLVYSIILGLVTYVFVATVTTFLALILGSIAPSIILTVAYTMVIAFVTMIFFLIFQWGAIEDAERFEPLKYILYFIPLFANGSTLTVAEVNNTVFIEGMVSYLLFGGLNVFLGLLAFNRKDLK